MDKIVRQGGAAGGEATDFRLMAQDLRSRIYKSTAGMIFALLLTDVLALDDLGGYDAAFLHDMVDQRTAGLSLLGSEKATLNGKDNKDGSETW